MWVWSQDHEGGQWDLGRQDVGVGCDGEPRGSVWQKQAMTTVGCSQGVGFLGAQATPNHPSTAAALTSVTKHTEVIRLPRAFLEPNSTDLRLGVLGASEQPPHMVGGGRVPQRAFCLDRTVGPGPAPHRKSLRTSGGRCCKGALIRGWGWQGQRGTATLPWAGVQGSAWRASLRVLGRLRVWGCHLLSRGRWTEEGGLGQ